MIEVIRVTLALSVTLLLAGAARADGDATRATEEAADLFYHVLVALHAAGGSLATLRSTLRARA